MSYTLQFAKVDTLAAQMSAAETSSATLTTGAFGTPGSPQLLVVDYDNSSAEVIECTMAGTALSSITRAKDGTSAVLHAAGAKVGMMFVPSHYEDLKVVTGSDGWTGAGETWTYASTTTNAGTTTTYSGTITISGDKTTKYSVGMRVKFTQTSIKYGVITNVVYSTPNTTLTVFFGTDYSLANAVITDPYWSAQKTPFGFPIASAKWGDKEQVTEAVSAATNTSWADIGTGCTIFVPTTNAILYVSFAGRLVNVGASSDTRISITVAGSGQEGTWYAANVPVAGTAGQTMPLGFTIPVAGGTAGTKLVKLRGIKSAGTNYSVNGVLSVRREDNLI